MGCKSCLYTRKDMFIEQRQKRHFYGKVIKNTTINFILSDLQKRKNPCHIKSDTFTCTIPGTLWSSHKEESSLKARPVRLVSCRCLVLICCEIKILLDGWWLMLFWCEKIIIDWWSQLLLPAKILSSRRHVMMSKHRDKHITQLTWSIYTSSTPGGTAEHAHAYFSRFLIAGYEK
jgi:hypothetical protein